MFSGWGGSDSRANAQKDEGPSLTTILNTQALRVQFALLVALCSDQMRRNLSANFDVSTSAAQGRSAQNNLLVVDDGNSDARAKMDQARRRREAELSSPEMQKLRKEAFGSLDAWRICVLKRVGEVVKVRSEDVRIARREAAVAADTAEKARRDAQFLAWAEGEESSVHHDDHVESEHSYRIRPIRTSLTKLVERDRVLILHCLLLLLLSLEHYSAYSRILLQYVAKSLSMPEDILSERESTVARGLLDSAASHMSAEEAKQKQANNSAATRKWKVGLATVGGAVLIGVTGGLAAPILAGAIGSIMGGIGLGAIATLLGPLATNFFLIGGLFGAFGGRMTGNIMDKYAREVKEFKFVPVHVPGSDQSPAYQGSEQFPIPNEELVQAKRDHQLRLTIGISGFLASNDDGSAPWTVLNPKTTEGFFLQFETESLMRLGKKLDGLIASYAVETLTWEVLRATLLHSISAGLMPIGLIRAANALDSPWGVAQSQSNKAGKVLAQALMDKVQGERPVTLIGYSLGARVIWSCLQSLAQHNAFGLIEQVIFMGAPVPADEVQWRKIRTLVVGRVVNAYSEDDWILGLVYRASGLQWGVAGLQKITGVEGVENVDLGGAVNGHTSYAQIVGQVLQRVGFADLDLAEVQKETTRKVMADNTRVTQKPKQKIDVNTLVKAHQGERGIVLEDNTRPLLDVEQSEVSTPEWVRAASPPTHLHDQKASTDLVSLLDTDNDVPPTPPLRHNFNFGSQGLPTRAKPTHSSYSNLMDDPPPSSANARAEQKVLLDSEPKTMVPLIPSPAPRSPLELSTSGSQREQTKAETGRDDRKAAQSTLEDHDDFSENFEDYDSATDSDDDVDGELQMIEPEALPEVEADYEPDRERVRFGTGSAGIDLMWDRGSRS